LIVPGHLIVTAAHVLNEWSSTGGMALGDASFEEVVTRDGRTITAVVLAVEPVADIAVLGAPDNQMRPKEADAFKAAVESIAPVPISTADFPLLAPVAVHLLTHTDHWVTAQAMQGTVNAPNLAITEASEGIRRGTSGGPVGTESGRLIGVVSTSGGVGMPDESSATQTAVRPDAATIRSAPPSSRRNRRKVGGGNAGNAGTSANSCSSPGRDGPGHGEKVADTRDP
jgi:S1-C subfamily serine protease